MQQSMHARAKTKRVAPAWLALLMVLACAKGVAAKGRKPASRRSVQGGKPASNNTVQGAVAHGDYAEAGHFPYIAALLARDSYYVGCGGTLVRPRLVVTAAHCVVDKRLRPTGVAGVLIGSLNLDAVDDPGEYRKVTRVVRHPSYNVKTHAFDIALLVLDTPSSALPAALAPANFKMPSGTLPGEYLYAAGWGATESEDSSNDLMYATLPLWSIAECTKVWRQIGLPVMPSTHLCAGWNAELQDTCAGDSGGPLVRSPSRGPDVLVGITSYGPAGCGQDDNMGAYTSVPKMRPWIDGQIRALRV